MSDFATIPTARAGLAAQLKERAAALPLPPAVRRAAPWLGGVAAIAALGLIVSAASRSPERALYAGAEPAEHAAMAAALDAASIPYTLADGSGAPAVASEDYHRARLVLAGEGLPRQAPSDPAIAALPMGASRAVEGEHLRLARETELARTIEAIDGVTSARVHLAQPDRSPFVRDRVAPSASVMVTLAGDAMLEDDQVESITHLVAASVPQLQASGVTVTDQGGRLLSGEGSPTDPKVKLRRTIEADYVRAIDALLGPVLGRDNYTREVSVELDFAQTEATRDVIPQGPAVVRAEQGETTVDPSAAAAGGIPGALSNTPPPVPVASLTPPAPIAPGAPPEPRRSESYNRDFALGREISVTRQGAPRIARVSVALALRSAGPNRPRSAAERADIEQLVKGAVGFDAQRGDQVVVASRPFAAATEAPTPTWWQDEALRGWAGPVVALIVSLAALFGVVRPFLRRVGRSRDEAVNDASEVAPPAQLALMDYTRRASAVREFVAEDPARAAEVVRSMMRQGSSRG